MVDAANEEIVGYYARYGFRRVVPEGLRMFLPSGLAGGRRGDSVRVNGIHGSTWAKQFVPVTQEGAK